MMLTLTLAAVLLAAPEPQAEPPMDWNIEVRGFTKHPQAKPEAWNIEVRGFTKHRKQAETPKDWIIDFQWPQPKAAPKVEPVEGQYHDDLSAFFKQWKVQMQVEAVETFYVDDLPAFLKSLKQQKP